MRDLPETGCEHLTCDSEYTGVNIQLDTGIYKVEEGSGEWKVRYMDGGCLGNVIIFKMYL